MPNGGDTIPNALGPLDHPKKAAAATVTAALFSSSGVNQNRDWPVVHEGHLHVGSENSACRPTPGLPFKVDEEGLIQRHRLVGSCGPREPRTIPLGGRRVERELTDREDLAIDLPNTPVHSASVIGKDSKADDLAGQPLRVSRCVTLFDTDKDQQSDADPRHLAAVDRHGSLTYSLDDNSHGCRV